MLASYRERIIRSFLLLGLIALAMLATVNPDAGASTKPKPPKLFALMYCWGGDSIDDVDPLWCPEAELVLNANGRIDVYDFDYVPDCGDWWTQKNGKYITFDLDVGVVYTGTRQVDGSYFGTMVAPNGMKGVWTGHFHP